MKTWTLVAACAASIAAHASASISYGTVGGSYTENFNGLLNTGTTNAWANDSTVPGWSAFQYTGGAIATYAAGTGSSGTGAIYSFGAASATERALGGLASGNVYWGTPLPPSGAIAGFIAVSFTNTTGATLSSFTLGFDGEQWRNGGNASAQPMILEYGYGATFAAVTTWTAPGGAFDWSSPVASTTAAAVDGNVAGLVAGRGGTIGSQTWNSGDTLWVRWTERNDAGNDHGLAIDNFSFSATPTPGSLALLGLAGALAGRRRR